MSSIGHDFDLEILRHMNKEKKFKYKKQQQKTNNYNGNS